MKSGPFTLRTETLGAVPIVNHFLDRIGLDSIIDRFVPADDARLKIDLATVIGLLVKDLNLIDHQPTTPSMGWAFAACSASQPGDVDAFERLRDRPDVGPALRTPLASLITHTISSDLLSGEFDINMDQLRQRLDHRHVLERSRRHRHRSRRETILGDNYIWA